MSFDKNKFLKSIEEMIIHFSKHATDPEVLQNTPSRFLNYLTDALSGYSESDKHILSKTFDAHGKHHSFVLLKKIRFTSTCQHHILPIVGHASIAYFPNTKVVGLSKLARIVDMFAHRLQLQEKMTHEIGTSIDTHLENNGVAVYISGKHMCICTRGALKPDSKMDTFYFSGKFNQPENQGLFLQAVGHK